MSTLPQCRACGHPITRKGLYCHSCGALLDNQNLQGSSPALPVLQKPQPLVKTNPSIKRPADTKGRNRRLFDLPDPTKYLGSRMGGFELSQTYPVNHGRPEDISEELYQHVYQKVQDDFSGDVHTRMEYYSDHKFGKGKKTTERRYITVTRNTIRKTRISIVARFSSIGKNIYMGADAYVLGIFDWEKCFMKVFLWPLVLFLAAIVLYKITIGILTSSSAIFLYDNSEKFRIGLIVFFVYLICIVCYTIKERKVFAKIFKIYYHSRSVLFSLRHGFELPPSKHSFDKDDVLMFTKSTLNLIINSSVEILKLHGIESEYLNEYKATINNYSTISISTEGGDISMVASNIGANNMASQTKGQLGGEHG